jgi:predicted transposase/invertase (TIGR01784 family)
MATDTNKRLMTITEELRKEGEARGIAKGVRQARAEIARKLLALGMTDSQIIEITRLTDGELAQIKPIVTSRL